MAAPLLTTKLYIPPVRPELVSRPRLIERLNVRPHRKLTLVSAPAGDVSNPGARMDQRALGRLVRRHDDYRQ